MAWDGANQIEAVVMVNESQRVVVVVVAKSQRLLLLFPFVQLIAVAHLGDLGEDGT
jgi:hypothetical protein